MTADNFTDAARAEAERRHNRIVRRNKTADEWLDEGRASGFTSGAEWARDHLAAQEPTDGERAVRALHRQFGVYEHEDDCPDTSDEHREAHHHGDSDGYGEGYCDQRPLYTLCDHCRDESGERLDWPCATIQALDSARAARRDEEKQ